MSQKQQHYEPEFKKQLVRLHLEEGRTLQSLSAEYGVAKSSITIWCRKFSKECQEKALNNPDNPNELEAYRFIDNNRSELGVRWLLRRLGIYPNAYYNQLKHRKAGYCAKKQDVLSEIENIYHSNNGVVGYRSMKAYLERRGIFLSRLTVHKYMNKELGLLSVVRRKKPNYHSGEVHLKFDGDLKQ